MLASTSSASTTLLSSRSVEGVKHLYRTILQQARLLASTLDDPVILSSHRFLARKNLEPLLSSPTGVLASRSEWPPSTDAKRIRRAQTHRRHLADANFGWMHSVSRALSVAYARTGKLRRDILTDLTTSNLSVNSSSKHGGQHSKRHSGPGTGFSRVLQTLLMSTPSMNGATVKSIKHLTDRPPPPFLPALDDALVKYFGKATSKRRVENAKRRFAKAYLKKVSVPVDVVEVDVGGGAGKGRIKESLFEHLESKARPPCQGGAQNLSNRGQVEQPCLRSARLKMESYRSRFASCAHRSRALRTHGWASHPTDFTRPRAQRRLYARLLDDVPVLLVDSTQAIDSTDTLQRASKKNDPLGIRSKVANVRLDGAVKLKVVRSRLAVGPKMRSAEVVPRACLDQAEVEEQRNTMIRGLDASEVSFLSKQGLL
ncbi:uncharacterized protein UMAG_03458 [Mycosarcoma maydis]|uniref:LYR motif-containing protein Cup1-like N-terminal domain-containing protein n=1 Tax=Mycosarcoma maydis TaxID=5270 RepID=A0A0D1CNY0_MYCMD|nr:uncharacterized protein UMAG_03458 [Ustilago maydis 521]KIS68363.1 hypothetical protein UMAG_03458 [Ustilago maydis 521]|eukprot:XP_011389914.1 hypothetical protein UMAG_03458 [Ustilago maydis 521]